MRYDMPLIDPPEAYITHAQEDYAVAVAIEAGCPDTHCRDLNTCTACGEFVCPDHSTDSVECVDIGDHHDRCVKDCTACADVRAREMAEV